MVYILEKYLCIKSTLNPNGKTHYIKVASKIWNKDHDFGFDIFDPKKVKKFIESYTFNNVEGQIATEFGEPFAYRMYVKGRTKGMPFKLGKNGKPAPFVHLFPGYDKNGKSLEWYPHGCLQ